MNSSVRSFTTEASEFRHALFIRRAVFVEEQKVPLHEEIDVYETECRHYLALVDNQPCGTGRWRITPKGVKIERLAVLASHRKHGVGAQIMRAMLIDIDQQYPNTLIYLHAQTVAAHFYQRLGFVEQGPPFDEANILHFYMCKPVA